MNTPPIPRWRLGFIAWRWRYLFAAVVFLTTLSGILVEWQSYRRSKEARVILRIENPVVIPLEEMFPDNLLDEAFLRCGCPRELRSQLFIAPFDGDKRVDISLPGDNDAAKTKLCNELGKIISDRAAARFADAMLQNSKWAAMSDRSPRSMSSATSGSTLCAFYPSPVLIETPATPPTPLKLNQLQDPAIRWSFWIAAGLLVAASLIYLAELLHPKQPSA